MQLKYFSIQIVTMAIAVLCMTYRTGAAEWAKRFETAKGLLGKAQESGVIEKAQGMISPKAAAKITTPEAVAEESNEIEIEERPVIELIESENPEEQVTKEAPLVEIIEPTAAAESTVLGSALEAAQELQSARGLYKQAKEILAPARTEAEKKSAEIVERQKNTQKIRAKEKGKTPPFLKYLNR